jgi:hypothetical protein
MLRAADLTAAAVQRVTTTVPVWNAENRSVTSWFDAGGGGAAVRIAADVSFAARGLSVEQHTTRVLMHLLAERDVPA